MPSRQVSPATGVRSCKIDAAAGRNVRGLAELVSTEVASSHRAPFLHPKRVCPTYPKLSPNCRASTATTPSAAFNHVRRGIPKAAAAAPELLLCGNG